MVLYILMSMCRTMLKSGLLDHNMDHASWGVINKNCGCHNNQSCRNLEL